jgi:SepF-like predicted cell division protein (DUF552 family)
MKKFLETMKAAFSGKDKPNYEELDTEEGYVELDTENSEARSRILVRPFQLDDFEDVKPILDSLREGYTIALVNIKPLKERDLVELKRAINKLKKTTEAIEGELAGFGDDYLVVTPSFASIYRSKATKEIKATEEVPGDE